MTIEAGASINAGLESMNLDAKYVIPLEIDTATDVELNWCGAGSVGGVEG